MKKKYVIKENHLFSKVYSRGKNAAKGCVAVYVLRNRDPKYAAVTRFGITVGKKLGCAPKRNRAKRLIRESLRLLCPKIKTGYLMIAVARNSCMEKGVDMWKVKSSLERSLRELDMLLQK